MGTTNTRTAYAMNAISNEGRSVCYDTHSEHIESLAAAAGAVAEGSHSHPHFDSTGCHRSHHIAHLTGISGSFAWSRHRRLVVAVSSRAVPESMLRLRSSGSNPISQA